MEPWGHGEVLQKEIVNAIVLQEEIVNAIVLQEEIVNAIVLYLLYLLLPPFPLYTKT